MTQRKRPEPAAIGGSQTDPSVDAFLRELKHPLKKDLEAVRRIILGVSPEIREGINWKAPTFRAKDDFATLFLRSTDRVQLIFHTGAKVKKRAKGMQVADPSGLIRWLAKDRCFVTLGAGDDVETNRAALEAIVREWIRQS